MAMQPSGKPGPPSAARVGNPAQNQAGKETEIFKTGESWAIYFHHLPPDQEEAPIVPGHQFQAPNPGPLAHQSFIVSIPEAHLRKFTLQGRRGNDWEVKLADVACHCRLRFFSCDSWGAPQKPSHNFHALWDGGFRQQGHFRFLAKLPLEGEFEEGRYYIVCEFYRGQFELDLPDALYTTGIFELTESEMERYA